MMLLLTGTLGRVVFEWWRPGRDSNPQCARLHFIECRTGDSRAYSRPAPASRGPGYTTSTRPIQRTGREPGISPGQSRYEKLPSLNFPNRYKSENVLTRDQEERFRQRLNPDQPLTF